MPNFDERIDELYIDLPEPPEETEHFVNLSRSGNMVFLSGVVPLSEGRLGYKGRVGLELNLDAGRAAAKAAALQALSVLRGELKSLNKIKRIVHMRLYVATGAEFKDHKKVAASAMEFLREIFGSFCKCSLETVGCASLPGGAAVELSLVVEVK